MTIGLDYRIYVAGHRGLAGSAIWRELERAGYRDLVGFTSTELDLRDSVAVADAIADIRPKVIIDAAAKVGGILANDEQPVEFLTDNLRIQTNLMQAAHAVDVDRFVFLGSSCIYPKFAQQPITESELLTGTLEPTNEAYAIAKIAGITLVDSYRREYGRSWVSAMPTNLYGPGDNFHPTNSHVIPALIRRFDEAAQRSADVVEIWGTGTPRREFLYIEDFAEAIVFIMNNFDASGPLNVGVGTDVSILELAQLVAETVGFAGEIRTDPSKPDGTPRKQLDTGRINALGWHANTSLEEGLAETYRWYNSHRSEVRG